MSADQTVDLIDQISAEPPRTVKVGPASYPVVFVDRIPAGEDNHASGHWDYKSGELQVAIDLNPLHGQKVDTIVHEALHVINEDRELHLDEYVIANLANGISSFLIDNPSMLMWIIKGQNYEH